MDFHLLLWHTDRIVTSKELKVEFNRCLVFCFMQLLVAFDSNLWSVTMLVGIRVRPYRNQASHLGIFIKILHPHQQGKKVGLSYISPRNYARTINVLNDHDMSRHVILSSNRHDIMVELSYSALIRHVPHILSGTSPRWSSVCHCSYILSFVSICWFVTICWFVLYVSHFGFNPYFIMNMPLNFTFQVFPFRYSQFIG